MGGAPITVIHADDHFFFREGVRAFLAHQPGLRLLGSAADGEEALALIARHCPAVLVTDVNMPVMDAHGLVPAVRRHHPATRIVVLSLSTEARDVLPLLEAGAAGYLLKDDAGASLADTIRAVAAGRAAITPADAPLVREDQRGGPAPPPPPAPPGPRPPRAGAPPAPAAAAGGGAPPPGGPAPRGAGGWGGGAGGGSIMP